MKRKEDAQRIVNNEIQQIYDIAKCDGRTWTKTEAMCYGLASRMLLVTIIDADPQHEMDASGMAIVDSAVATHCAALSNFINAGALDEDAVYQAYVNLVQKWQTL